MFGLQLRLPPPPPPLERTEKAMAAYKRECQATERYNDRQRRHELVGAIAFGLFYAVGVPFAVAVYLIAMLK